MNNEPKAVSAVPEGWQIVPKESSAEMWAAFDDCCAEFCAHPQTYWDAMLAAAPRVEEGAPRSLTPGAMQIGGRYNWRYQPERLVYLGTRTYPGDYRRWHNFAKIDTPEKVWCEVLDEDLLSLEETHSERPQDRTPDTVRDAVAKLVFMARTSGGTAGRDEALCQACEIVEFYLSLPKTEQQPANAGSAEPVYQVTAWGETEYPEVVYASGLADVPEIITSLMFYPVDDEARSRVASMCEDLAEGELPWKFEFEIGGIRVEKVFMHGAHPPAAAPVDDADEAYNIGRRDGYEEAVQDIDVLTGGDGEYRYCLDHDPDNHCPDAEVMKAKIVERFQAQTAPAPQPVPDLPKPALYGWEDDKGLCVVGFDPPADREVARFYTPDQMRDYARAALASAKPVEQDKQPCRSPYCECESGRCSTPGRYDARAKGQS